MATYLVEVVAYKETETTIPSKYNWEEDKVKIVQKYVKASDLYEAVTKFLLVKGYKAEAICVTEQEPDPSLDLMLTSQLSESTDS